MASIKQISMRLKSVRNMGKITKSMKMVSASKYTKAERELKMAKPFGEGSQAFYEKAEVQEPEDNSKAPTILFAISSDKGLCGAIHTSVAKSVRVQLNEKQDTSTAKVICVGDKMRAALQRNHGDHILMVCKEIGRIAPTFTDASKLAQEAFNSGYKFEGGKIIYNSFVSAVSYRTKAISLFSPGSVEAAPKLSIYDSVDPDVIQNYMEYSLASLLFYAMKENACSEQSSRMSAMDNASKNAEEMTQKLSLLFNRTRQASITRELTEIVSGASAISEGRD
jgi:F-type H+-transporting ATPase subunit gamma